MSQGCRFVCHVKYAFWHFECGQQRCIFIMFAGFWGVATGCCDAIEYAAFLFLRHLANRFKTVFFLEKPADQRTHKCVDPPMFHTESNKIVVFGRCAVRIADSDETWRTDPCEKHSKNWPPTWIQNFGWLTADLGLNPLAAALPALVLWSGTFLGSYVVNRVLPTRLVECSNFKCRSDQYS